MPADLTETWASAQERMPAGWTLDSLRCASTGLTVGQRSEDWVAVALGPDGQERAYRAPDPIEARRGLADSLAL